MTLTFSSSSPSVVSGFSSKGFEESSWAPSKGAAGEEEELDDVVAGGAEGKVGSEGEDAEDAVAGAAGDAVAGVSEDAVDGAAAAELASSGVRMTPPGGIFSLLYLHPGT